MSSKCYIQYLSYIVKFATLAILRDYWFVNIYFSINLLVQVVKMPKFRVENNSVDLNGKIKGSTVHAITLYIFYDITKDTEPIGLLPAAWSLQQHNVFEEHIKTHNNQEHNDKITERKTPVTLLTSNIRATSTTTSSSDFYYNGFLLLGKPSVTTHYVASISGRNSQSSYI